MKLTQRTMCHNSSRGVAAVEAALILPFLVLATLTAIDISQYISFSQSMSNASREGARIASRNQTSLQSEVESDLLQYLANNLPNISSEVLRSALTIEIRYGTENQLVTDGDLMAIGSGDRVSVRVAFDYSKVRWFNGPDYWGGNIRESTTFFRRE